MLLKRFGTINLIVHGEVEFSAYTWCGGERSELFTLHWLSIGMR